MQAVKGEVAIKAHSELGASTAHRWLQCPGSVRMSRGMPAKSSRYADEGTAAHEVAYRCLTKDLDPETFLGVTIEGVAVSDEMIDAVRVFISYVRGRIEEGCEYGFEERFDLAPLHPPQPMFGTCDAWVWNPMTRVLEVIDLKYGTGVVVEVDENEQTMYYALGAVVRINRRPAVIRTTIVQPRAYHPDGAVRSWEFPWETLVAFKQRLFEGARKAQEPDAPIVPGEWCRFCPAAAVCPAQHRQAVEVAQQEFEVEPFDLPKPATLSLEKIKLVLDKAPLIEAWFNEVRRFVEDRLAAGLPVPGYKLVPKRATRRWKDEEEAIAGLRLFGVAEDELYTRKLISPAQAEKKVPREALKDLIVSESSGTKLVPDTDSRPALPPAAVEEFAAVTDAGDPPKKAKSVKARKARKRQ